MAGSGRSVSAGIGELKMLGVGLHGPMGPRADEDRDPATGGGPPLDPGPPPDPGVTEALAVIAAVEGVGPVTLERLLSACGGPREILAIARGHGGAAELRAASRDPEERRPTLTEGAAAALVDVARVPEPILASMREAGVHALGLDDPGYPARLRLIELPPRVVFVRGSDAALEAAQSVAIVGTRHPTDAGRRTASRIGAALARAHVLVVSGLAIGIDGAAHESVVEASGRTVAVIGGGHGRLFPAAHDRLADAIVDGGGAVISEHAPGVPPTRGTFPRRNRVISGLVDAVVVVEAGARSGALLTAAWALEQGRECFLVPGSIEAQESAGCLAWLREFAGVARIVAGVPQLLEDLGVDALAALPVPDRSVLSRGSLVPPARPTQAPSAAAVALDLPEREGRLLQALVRGAATADELAAVTGFPIGAVLGGLTGLEGRGLVAGTYGRYRVPDSARDRVAVSGDSAA